MLSLGAGRSKRKRYPGVSCPGMLNMIEVDREDDCDSPRGLSFRQRTDNVINNMKMLGDAYKYTPGESEPPVQEARFLLP